MATTSLCRNCGLTLSSVAAFDAHRTGSYGEPIYRQSRTGKSRYVVGHTAHSRRCLTVAEIQAVGMTQNAKGWWMLPAPANAPWATTTPEEEFEEATPSKG